MRARKRRRIFNIFAFTLLAFAIYLVTFYKEKSPVQAFSHVTAKAR